MKMENFQDLRYRSRFILCDAYEGQIYQIYIYIVDCIYMMFRFITVQSDFWVPVGLFTK